MNDLPQEFDLKFLPDWLKESPATNRYADYQGDTGDRPPRRDDRGFPGQRPGGRGPGGPRRDDNRGPSRGPRPGGGSGGPPGDRPRGPRPAGPGGDRRDSRPGDRRQGQDSRPPREAPRPAPAELKVEILPEPNAASSIAKQVKNSGRAYAVFSTSKLFLERPERHRVKVTSSDAAAPLFQVGDGPISFDRQTLERNAFFTSKDEYYTEETVQGEPIKGNFSNVARVRGTDILLGPTNYHGYQPALRRVYEERYSRRMPFPEYQQREIEVLTAEQAIADWKEQARTTTTYSTTKEAEPVVFKSLSEAEQHFRKHYLPLIVKSGQTLECSGQSARAGSDRYVGAAVREAWERESRFPQQIVNGLRPFLTEVGLHYFKHRKRVLFVSATKPQRHPLGQTFSAGITSILQTVETSPRIKRPDLAVKILGEAHESPEMLAQKAQLASDLHYLLHIGHVIEFSDGALELPLSPQDKPAQEQRPGKNQQKPKQTSAAPALAAASEEAEVTGEAAEAAPAAEATAESAEASSAETVETVTEHAPETLSSADQTDAPIEDSTPAENNPLSEPLAEVVSTAAELETTPAHEVVAIETEEAVAKPALHEPHSEHLVEVATTAPVAVHAVEEPTAP